MIYTFIVGSMLFPLENATAINHSINTGQYNTGVPPKEPLMDVTILARDITMCQKADDTIFEGSCPTPQLGNISHMTVTCF